jgi:hypothetical protein
MELTSPLQKNLFDNPSSQALKTPAARTAGANTQGLKDNQNL